MKARNVERRLEQQLPLLTDRFTTEQTLTSITASGTTATATTATAHGLSTSNKVMVAGTTAPVIISTIDRVETIATVVTSVDHDLTEAFFTTLTLSGATESEFNGQFKLLTVPNRRTFTMEMVDAGPTSATGSPQLDDPGLVGAGYNGIVELTDTPSSTTFTYELSQALTVDAAGANMRIITGVKIYSAISEARALQVFESKNLNNLKDGQLALFVVLGQVDANRDRNTLNDGISSAGVSGDQRQQILQSVSCMVFQKVTNDGSGADAGDSMQDIAASIIKVLAGWSPGVDFAVDSGNKLRFVRHGLLGYDGAIYSHLVEFQLLGDIDTVDLKITPDNVAFRDISMTIFNDQGDQELTTTINLDDEPLGA